MYYNLKTEERETLYMLQFEELRLGLLAQEDELKNLYEAMDIETKKSRLEELEAQTAVSGFWNDQENSQKVVQEMSHLKNVLKGYEKLRSTYEDTLTLIELAIEMEDESVYDEAKKNYDFILADLETQKLSTLLTGEYDENNAILTFHAGAGGTEAQDWAQMLYRMYTRWSERHGFKYKILDYLDGDEAGIKSASILIEGENAYGFLKSEAGVHRLVRVSPFDASGRRQTSFASLEVMPELSDATDIEINESDLKVDTYRAGGAGGQHVNKTESAVRITHLPTGVVVACQNERSQFQNREVAMKMLKAKLAEIKEREHLEKIEDIKGVQKEIGWGNQIRSYVLQPYTMVKDHRTGAETGNVDSVLDGNIDLFINAYLKWITLGESAGDTGTDIE